MAELASEPSRRTVWLQHNLVCLALHELRPAPATGAVRPLLLLHGLGEHTPATAPTFAADWPGAVWGLDFTGHGASTVPHGGGYTAEVLMGDADLALAHLGSSTVVGRGLGAYIALLIAGARPQLVHGAVLTDGPGLAGGPVGPGSTTIITLPEPDGGRAPDPFALAELARDVRPPDYATSFVRQATQLSDLDEPITVVAKWRPPWLEAVAGEIGVADGTIEQALAIYGS